MEDENIKALSKEDRNYAHWEKGLASVRFQNVLDEEFYGQDLCVTVITDREYVEMYFLDFIAHYSDHNFEEDKNNPIVAFVSADFAAPEDKESSEDCSIQLIYKDGSVSFLSFITTSPASVYLNGEYIGV